MTVSSSGSRRPSSLRGWIDRYRRGWRPVQFFPSLGAGDPCRRGLGMFLFDGLFGNISESFVGPFLSLFLLALGASGQQVGFLASISSLLGAVAFLPGAQMAARVSSYRKLVVGASLAARLTLPLLLLVPWLVTGQTAIGAVITLAALRTAATQFGVPAWTAFSAVIVPQRLRGRYFSTRNVVMSVAALAIVPLAGRLISSLGSPSGYQLCFGLAFGAGLLATLAYSRIPLPASSQRGGAPVHSLRKVLAGLSARPAFTRFCLTSMLLGLSVQTAAPFFNVHLVRNLGANAGFVGILTTIGTVATLAGTRFFGPRVDRRGLRWTMVRTSPFIALIPFGWLFVRAYWQVVPFTLMGNFGWAGYNLATFNLLLATTPGDERPLYSAIYNTATALTAVLGPLLGGFLFDHWGFQATLVTSFTGRATAALLIYLLIREAGAGAASAGRAVPGAVA